MIHLPHFLSTSSSCSGMLMLILVSDATDLSVVARSHNKPRSQMSHISSCFSFPHFKYCVPHIIVKFLWICQNEDTENVVLVLAGEHCEHLLTNRRYFCLYCTFKNGLRQFAQLCSLYVVPGSTSRGKNTYIRFCLHFYRVKLKQYIVVFSLLNSCTLWFPEFMKDFWSGGDQNNKVVSRSVITGCKFHFRRCLWRQLQNVGLRVEYKEGKQVRLKCRMRATLA